MFASLTLSLVATGWILIRTAQKHDAWIVGKLSGEFTEDAGFDKVHFTVGAGSVSLKGSVTVLEDKRQAERRARAVDHVRTMTNDISVDTRRIPDGILRIQLKHDLRKQGLNGLNLKVRRGVVTVRGTVPSNRERVLTLVAGTQGVRGIRDRTMALK